MKNLDVYQTLAVFMPGYFFAFGSYILLKKAGFDIPLDISSIGGSIALIVISYVIGQLVQVFGNAFEWLWRKVRPIPSVRIQKGDEKILSSNQRQQLIDAMKQKVGLQDIDISQLSKQEWLSYVGSVASAVRHSKQMEQIDVFNAHYGMFRGLVAASFLLALGSWFLLKEQWYLPVLALIVLGLLALYRMDRFDKNYARELFRQFLQISKQENTDQKD